MADGVTTVSPVASASAMMPREIASRTFWISVGGEAVRDPPARRAGRIGSS